MAFLLLFFMKLLALKYTLTKLITASCCERVLKRIENFRDIKILTPFFLWGGGGVRDISIPAVINLGIS